ncbi:MAG: extracellular solute-binding protein, partial [Rhizobiaceae bacterium]|nr:extracellular solute-binding protein [Rhizobiaceae bacterium]
MNMATRSRLLASAAVVATAMAASAGIARAETDLTFVWHAGTCADALVAIAKDYPDKSVRIVPALVPYGPEWHNKIASEFAIQGDAFDFAMWDSQSTAEFATHAVKLNDIFDKSSYLKADIFPAASLSRYGEYPDGSGEYYGLPANQDAYGLTYRKDLFEDPKEQ